MPEEKKLIEEKMTE
jgi:hypothetical protein